MENFLNREWVQSLVQHGAVESPCGHFVKITEGEILNFLCVLYTGICNRKAFIQTWLKGCFWLKLYSWPSIKVTDMKS